MKPALIWDCSAAIAMAFEDERDDYSCRALRIVRREGALVPAIWPMEMVNILRVSERRNRIEPSASREFLDMLSELDIRVDSSLNTAGDMATLYETAGKSSLTAYDASYLRLALTTGLPLAAKDGKLKEAAKIAGVKLFA